MSKRAFFQAEWIVYLLLLALVGCSGGGAVVFAPTEPPPDLSPLRYVHPSGAFSLLIPRNWSVHEQNAANLATATFAAPDDLEPLLSVAVLNQDKTVDSGAFADLINRYQSQIRPDVARYTEQDRQAMGDGSWRLTGTRQTIGGKVQAVNTFIEAEGPLIGVLDVIVPEASTRFSEIQTSINTFTMHTDTALQPADLSVLSAATRTTLDIQNVATWMTPDDTFYITGEVANYGLEPLSGVPVRAALWTADGLGVAEAMDTVMGYTILPGEFAPFSLRFGQGQPAMTTTYTLSVGNAEWQPGDPIAVSGAEELTWTDESSYNDLGHLIIDGEVVNTGTELVSRLQATVTVFDLAQHVIAARFVDITPEFLAPEESTTFQIIVPEMGGTPANYIVNIQGIPALAEDSG